MGLLNEIDTVTVNKGILGRQRELAAAKQAMATLNVSNRPAFFNDLVEAVGGGIGLQQSLSYSEAITPGAAQTNAAARAIAGTSGKAVAAADRVQRDLSAKIQSDLTQAAQTLRDDVKVSQVAFREELLRDDGVILGVQKELRTVRAEVDGVNFALGKKADLTFVTDIVTPR
jgi:hypothetical protein